MLTSEFAARGAAARARHPLAADLLRREAPHRLYATAGAGVFVPPAYRRQGIASALLATMLRADRRTSAPGNVLLATQTGDKLSANLGYRQLCRLLLYQPKP